MASFNKFNCFVEDLAENKHDLDTDTIRVMLTNTVPNAADIQVDTDETVCQLQSTSNANEITAEHGYTKKGPALDLSSSGQSGGTYKLIFDDEVVTASGGTIGPLRYAVIYNDSKGTSAARPVIGWYDYGSSITLQDTETLTIDFNPSNGLLQIA